MNNMAHEFMVGRRHLHTNAVHQSHDNNRGHRCGDNLHKCRLRCCHAVTLSGNSSLAANGTAKLLTPLIKASLRNVFAPAEGGHRQ
ncbi:MAG: hypothetical protein ABGX71_01890, partial [Methyloprofundus sp.]